MGLSESVHKLMSDAAQKKLRHLDTVTVKGSQVRQKIFTYDAKEKGVDFFLYQRSDDEEEVLADRYDSSFWDTDQDLLGMRQHVTTQFLEHFEKGRDLYLKGERWSE